MTTTSSPDSNVGSGIGADTAPRSWPNGQSRLARLMARGRIPLTLLAIVIALASFRIFMGRRNLALGKRVQVAGVSYGSAEGIVNGWVEWGTFALFTRFGVTSLKIDLEQVHSIGMIRVYGRGDGCAVETSTPVTIEYSADGLEYHKVKYCGPVMSQVRPCTAELPNVAARYVRLSHPRFIVLSEVEVFAGQ